MDGGSFVEGDLPGREAVLLASRVIGRDLEIAAFDNDLEVAASGQGGVVFLVGEPGIGKSRLAQVAASRAAARGMAVLQGRAVPARNPLAYRPFAEALCGAVRSGVVAGDAPGLASFRAILGLLVPEWRVEETRVDDSLIALAEAVLRLLRVAAGRRGCLMVLEDLHWADPETVRIIEYLADNLASERVLCLVTVRDEGRSAGLELGRTLQTRRVSRVVALSRLTRTQVGDMVRSCLDSGVVSDDVFRFAERADGVPFLVEELLGAAVASGALLADGRGWTWASAVEPVVPSTFSESMRDRLAAFEEPTRAVVLAAAVLGREFDWRLLSDIAQLSEEQVITGLRAAVDTQIVAVHPIEGAFRFRHALSRDAVLGDLLPPERAVLSRRAVQVVDARHPDLDGDWCELAADLAVGAGDRGRAGALLVEASRRNLDRGALASAEAGLDRARNLLKADQAAMLEVDECLCQVLSLAGKRERALEVSVSLLGRLGTDRGVARRRAEVYLGLARVAFAATSHDEAHQFLARARSEAAEVADERLIARVNVLAAQIAVVREPEQAPALARTALAAAEHWELPDVACEALEVVGRIERRRDLGAAEETFTRALAVAEAAGLTVWRARALHELGTIDLLRGGPVTRLEEAKDLAMAQGAVATAAVVDVQIAAAVALGDHPEQAGVAARRAAELARRYGFKQTLASALALEAHVHARASRSQEMHRCIQEALALTPGSPDVEVKASFAAAVFAFLEEDQVAARRHLSAAADRARTGPGGDYSAVPAVGLLALVRRLDGTHGPDSGSSADPVHFLARAFQRYADAVAAGRAGEPERAVALVAAGDRMLADHEWFYQLGRRLLSEAALGEGWGHPVAWLREALAFFEHRQEHRIASACRSLLRKAGAPVPRRDAADDVPSPLQAAGITSRELEVLRLLGLGLPNKEIAARLYLSTRTVERHVANIATKVGVTRRAELIAFAARTLDGS